MDQSQSLMDDGSEGEGGTTIPLRAALVRSRPVFEQHDDGTVCCCNAGCVRSSNSRPCAASNGGFFLDIYAFGTVDNDFHAPCGLFH